MAQTFDGNSAPARKTETSRWEDQTIQESTTTTYYLRSTGLGGKVVAELDNTGYKRKGYIYAGGMQVAQQDGSQVSWLSTSPSTGSEYPMDNARHVGRKELDPLGADVTTQPDPAPVEPPFYNPKFDQMPIQYEGGPSQESRDAMTWWEGQLAITEQAIRDRDDAQAAWQSGNRSGAEAILNNNPNVGVQTGDGKSYFGNDAAELLYGPDSSNSDEGTHDLTSAYHVNIFGGGVSFSGQVERPQSADKHHQTFTVEQRLTASIAGNVAITSLIERSECREYVTGRKMPALQAVKLFLNVVNSMTYDPQLLDFAETDEDFGRIRLGFTFFDLSAASIGVSDLLEQTGGVKDTSALMTAVSQQAYIELHEFKHKATRKKHVGVKALGAWYKGLYDNCFKEK